MSITLNEILTLVGNLDDTAGFDAPRERFRRFLTEHVTDVTVAQPLIEACERSVGEQHHRALQDLVVLLGRFLGFETTFGRYEALAGAVKFDGQWRSRGRLDVVLELRTDQTAATNLESLTRSVSAVAATTQTEMDGRIGLCVVARHYAGRARLEQSVDAEKSRADLRVVSVQSLLSLAAAVGEARLAHDDIVRLLRSASDLDFVIGLLGRPASDERPQEQAEDSAVVALSVHAESACWVATITGNEMATPEQLLSSVIAKRRVLGICHAGTLRAEGAAGDWVCFYLFGKGIVGHAQLAEVVEDAGSVVRNAEDFSRVYRLAHVDLYAEPIAEALRASRPFLVPPEDVPLSGPCLSPISRQDFIAMTDRHQTTPSSDAAVTARNGDAAIERRLRSHA